MITHNDQASRDGFIAWAATEGITNVVFGPVTAVGRTLGNVSGQRDYHLVLLDREWAIWCSSRTTLLSAVGVRCGKCDATITVAGCACGSNFPVTATDPLRDARIANERDRTVVARCLNAFDRAVSARGWLTQGRGPYEWDDDRFYAEFGHALDEFRKAVEPLRRIGIDMTNVPKDDAGVAEGKAAATRLIAEPAVQPVCPKCRGGGMVILADLPLEGRICGGRCPCGAPIGTPKEKPTS